MKKAWIVARHEFLTTVRRAWFVIVTFLLPLVFGGIAFGMGKVAEKTIESSIASVQSKPMGYVDHWGGLVAHKSFRKYETEELAKEALLKKEVGTYIILEKDYLTSGRIDVMTLRRPTLLTSQHPILPDGLKEWLIDSILSSAGPEQIARAKRPIVDRMVFLDETGSPSQESGEEARQRSYAAYGFFILLLTSIFTSSAYLLQGMAEEKENRVLEMVLSSVKPDELMFGKLIGLGAAGLLQMTVWTSMSFVVVLYMAIQFIISPLAFALGFTYFLLGYLLFGSLMLGFGSLGTNLRESQQMASVWSFIGATPAFIIIALFEEPQGVLARIFSYIPFTAPTTMIFRYVVDPKGTSIVEIVASMAVLLVSTWLAIKVSSRLYRAGLLLYGKRPGPREIWRWIVSAR